MENQFEHQGCGGIVVKRKGLYECIRCRKADHTKSAFSAPVREIDDPFGDFYPDGPPEWAPGEKK